MENYNTDRNIPPTTSTPSAAKPLPSTVTTTSATATSNTLDDGTIDMLTAMLAASQNQQHQNIRSINEFNDRFLPNESNSNVSNIGRNGGGDGVNRIHSRVIGSHNGDFHTSLNGDLSSSPVSAHPQITGSLSINSVHRNLDEWLENCMRDQVSATSNTSLSNNNTSNNIFENTLPINSSRSLNNPTINISNFASPSHKPSYVTPNYFNNFLNPNSLQKSLTMLQASMSQDFTSLPPGVNMSTTSTVPNSNAAERDQFGSELNGYQDSSLLNVEYNNQNRRFSDPGMPGQQDEMETTVTKDDKVNDSQSSDNNAKLLATLLEQINLLHETNSKIVRNLHETKVDIEAIKHAPSWGLRHRRDSISGLSTHSQPLGYNLGTQSPAPTYHSGMYTPGMLTDVVREVREAARIREEALLNRVKALVDERSWTLNETNFRFMREIEDLKLQVHNLKSERKEYNQKFMQMDTEMKTLKSLMAQTINFARMNSAMHTQPYQTQEPPNRQTIRTSVAPPAKRNNLNLSYGVVNHEDGIHLQTVKENETSRNHNNSSINNNHRDELSPNSSAPQGYQEEQLYASPEQRTSSSNVSFGSDGQLVQLEKDNLALRRELQSARASSSSSESRIKVLEQLVATLHNTIPRMQMADVGGGINAGSSSQSAQPTNGNGPVLKIIEKNHHLTSNDPQTALHVQDVSPIQSTLSVNRKTTIGLKGPVTDL